MTMASLDFESDGFDDLGFLFVRCCFERERVGSRMMMIY